ncbi:MAG TPA: hypothetical protein VGU68_08455, partial [Ktedonobacteraceae bacterium]|nr:hypothetical protein [Ktedonobacteraceae bacterium]
MAARRNRKRLRDESTPGKGDMACTPWNRYLHEIGRLVFAQATRKYAIPLARVALHSLKRLISSV